MPYRSFNLGHREQLTWPMDQTQLDNLDETLLVSPRVGDDHGYSPPSELVYSEQVQDVYDIRALVEAEIWPSDFMEVYLGDSSLSPLLSKYFKLSKSKVTAIADVVKTDHPFDLWDKVIEPYATDNDIPFNPALSHNGNPFVEKALTRSRAHARIAGALDKAFDVKYYFGVCRPIEFFDTSVQRFITPNHPECPAGHGSFSGAAAKAFEVEYSPNQSQIDAVVFATKQFAMFRSFSAMHIPYSNLLGWTIGYEYEP